MTQEFNRQKLFENVSAIIQDRGLKIGDVESAVGISAGYLSRLSKKDSDASISVDLVCKLSHFFGVSVDALLEGDFSVATNNTKYFESFLDRLRNAVDSGHQEWETITEDDVDISLNGAGEKLPIVVAYDPDDSDTIAGRKYRNIFSREKVDEEKKHQLSEEKLREWDDGKHWYWSGRRVRSFYYPNEKAWVTGTSFKFILDDNTSMYLFKMSFEIVDTLSQINGFGALGTSTLSGYEILFEERKLSENRRMTPQPDPKDIMYECYPICNTISNGVNLSGTVDKLYWTTMRHEKDLKIDKTVRGFIDCYTDAYDRGYF
ncbi:MAG: helix-turn-helix domain-containing protein [Oscillospiraceae bacterium]|nr:helix-turn-helix domain-containing protein [Oscillospiraceae bacterium]